MAVCVVGIAVLCWAVWRPAPQSSPSTAAPTDGGATSSSEDSPDGQSHDGSATDRPAGDGFFGRLVAAAVERTRHQVTYDPAYVQIDYPGGDVPDDRGVCADVIVRAYRKVGIDLQKEVHEDMAQNFTQYPQFWGLRGPDSNIDHRRVPNLQTFFSRNGRTLPASDKPDDYSAGDLVVWSLSGGRTHVGLVIRGPSDEGRALVVHNIGSGPKVEDALFAWPVIGHYRYPPEPE